MKQPPWRVVTCSLINDVQRHLRFLRLSTVVIPPDDIDGRAENAGYSGCCCAVLTKDRGVVQTSLRFRRIVELHHSLGDPAGDWKPLVSSVLLDKGRYGRIWANLSYVG